MDCIRQWLRHPQLPRLETRMLATRVLAVSPAWLLSHEDFVPDPVAQAAFIALCTRRLAGEPMAYILGEREFYGREFLVSPATLIPRPDTETVIELGLRLGVANAPLSVLDLGTGSGALAITFALERRAWQVSAVERSAEALAVAEENATRLGARVTWYLGSWFDSLPLESRFDLVVSNPPYIADEDIHLQHGDVRFEPRTALVSGTDGLDDLRQIIAQAPLFLAANGWLVLEHGFTQAPACCQLLQAAGFSAVASAQDLAGHWRVSYGQWRPQSFAA